MERTCKIGDNEITLEELEDVVAIELEAPEREEEEEADFGERVDLAEEFDVNEAEARAFESGGWIFVRSTEETRSMVERWETPSEAKSAGKAYRTEEGRLYVLGDRLTVRLDEDLSENEIGKILADAGLEIVQELTFASNLYEVRVTGEADPLDLAAELDERSDVVYAEPNFVEHIPQRYTPSDPDYDQQWQWNNDGSGGATAGADVDAEEAWEYAQGGGTRIAVIDNGFDVGHPDLSAAVTGAGYFQSTPGGGASFQTGTSGYPDNDHGTFCAGMAVAREGNSEGGVGAAYEADFIPVACLSDQLGTQTTLARAVAYAADPTREVSGADPADGADVISCSLGPDGQPFPMRNVLRNAIDFAVNNGRDGQGTPVFWAVENRNNNINQDQVCNYQNTVAVGRTDNDDQQVQCAFGGGLDFMAPGQNVYSTDNRSTSGGYGTWSGTSFATPAAAGIGALVIEMDPDLDWDEVRDVMRDTCDQVGGVTYGADDRNQQYGFGRVNAADAICRALRSVELETPNLTFNDVLEDRTVVRAARFTVRSCDTVDLQVSDGPTLLTGDGSFGLPDASAITVGPTAPGTTAARIWVSYTAEDVPPGGSATGEVTIRDTETEEEWAIPLSATVIEREPVAVDLVLDRSWSMSRDSGVVTTGGASIDRMGILQSSAPTLVELLKEDDAVGVVRFNHNAQAVTSDVAEAGAAPFGSGRTQAKTAIQNLSPSGDTSIGDGVAIAHGRLASLGGYEDEAIVVFTDGHENEPRSIADVSGMIDESVFAIGLGTPEQLRPSALNSLANGTGGYVVLTDELGNDDNFLLTKYFMQILAGVKNNDVVVDPEGYLTPEATHRIPFHVTEADVEVDVALVESAQDVFRLSLETPAGDVLDAADARVKPELSFVDADAVTYYRFNPPVSTDSGSAGSGRWHAILEIDEKYFERYLAQAVEAEHELDAEQLRSQGVRYNLSVFTDSGLGMRTTLSQDSYEPGARLTLRTVLRQYGNIPITDATVSADVSSPDGTERTVTLDPVEEGVFETNLATSSTGVYRTHVHADGRSLRGKSFTREEIRTASVWHGGDDPEAAGQPNAQARLLCELLECLSRDSFAEAMEQWGVDARAFRECVERYCDGVDELGGLEGLEQGDGTTARPGAGSAVDLDSMTVSDLLERVTMMQMAEGEGET